MWKRSLLILFALAVLAVRPAAWATDFPHPEDESDRYEQMLPKLPGDTEDDEGDHEEDDRETLHPKLPPPPIHEEPGDATSPKPSPITPPKPHRESPEYDDDFAYYGRVQAVSPQVVVGSRTLVGRQELLGFLAPGMQVEVEGRVVNGRLEVKEVHVLEPRPWAYFEGPSPELGWSQVWFLNGRVWRTQAADPGPRARLLACYEHGWLGLPPELVPDVTPPEPGLWLLEGLVWNGQVRWTQLRRLGSCDN